MCPLRVYNGSFITWYERKVDFFPQNFFHKSPQRFFLENWYIVPRYIKNVPNIEVCDFIPALSTTLSIKQVIVVYKYIICYFSDVLASDTETTLGDTEDRILRRQRARWVKQKYDRNSMVVVRMKFSKGLKGTKLKGPIMSFFSSKY